MRSNCLRLLAATFLSVYFPKAMGRHKKMTPIGLRLMDVTHKKEPNDGLIRLFGFLPGRSERAGRLSIFCGRRS